ncbi:sugar ABC transporter ATP-binding protein [Nakamurella lactea]|uniref:sugar ABC transporter ATP-binding protein n=1 Tax=Nakamurella lactea TaxID=459515 RepID=UPI000403598E|nr:sugar ABC transporter ATP-binding protein [Nakamurella lactea]
MTTPGGLQVPRLELRGVTKHFGAVTALTDVSFAVNPGSIHALVGENGAGKSTLVGVITGLLSPNRGSVLLDGEPISFRDPRQARASGVAAVYQDPKLFGELDVAENIFAGAYPQRMPGVLDRQRMHADAAELLGRLGVQLDTHALVSGLSLAEAQFVELARALAVTTRLLILDEPTSSLTPLETERLFQVVRRLRDAGTAVLWISHRMEEIHALTDHVSVLRDGRHIRTAPTVELDDDAIVALMVGRGMERLFAAPAPAEPGATLLELRELTVAGEFERVSFELRAGEIVGMAGIVGAGRTEVAQAICGVRRPTGGQLLIDGTPRRISSPRELTRHGIAYVPEDRDVEGLIPSMSVLRNITLPSSSRLSNHGILSGRAEARQATGQLTELDIKTSGLNALVSSLSGGNRQKVALARWLATEPRILILDEPTHGIDIVTKTQVHRIIERLAREKGMAVLVISSDLNEVLALSDRILVMAAGRISASIDRADASEEAVMAAATGVPALAGGGR